MSIIIGIDPGTTTVGFAIMALEKNYREVLNYGIIETKPKEKLELKLVDIVNDLEEIIEKYKPTIAGVEKLFFTNNQKTGIDVAHARGAILQTLAKKGIHIYEFTPLQVKKGICGNGSANKLQVQKALKLILKMNELPKPDDAADAIAIAYIASLQKRLI
ncbi:MAG: crossover junction endodeoxyribonuclease RuvC [Candidatus Gracilibacteria bacterium]|nr:crossover junction endodeoxyribonuclease RuvC [Candidatus Gracilibacteria bacterium]MDD2908149.1 crossover junction endodeoxyribonuclease RuvC [Candidatus Gracilibacteria bacterium]